jgi:hypothetical protein
MGFVIVVVILALVQYIVFGMLVGRARGKYNVPAPACSGDPIFERYWRVHQNTLEQLVVFLPAITDNAAGIIISHNHPSGTLEASRADIQVTDRLKEVAKLVGIELLDHVIISKNGYYSFSDEGIL